MTVSPALLSLIAFVALNSILFAYFLGRLASRVDRNNERISEHERRVADIEGSIEQFSRDDVRIGYRIEGLEKLEGKVDALRDQVARGEATAQTERAAMKMHSEKIETSMSGIHRQLANIASGKTRLLELSSTDIP